MFWGAIVKEDYPLQSKKIFEQMEFPAVHLSQAVLVAGNKAKIVVQLAKNSEPIVIALLSDKQTTSPITCYVNMTQTLTIKVIGKGAEVHLCGHLETEGHQEGAGMFDYGEEEEESEQESESEEEAPKAVEKKVKAVEAPKAKAVEAPKAAEKKVKAEVVAEPKKEVKKVAESVESSEDDEDYDDEEEGEEDMDSESEMDSEDLMNLNE